MIRTFVTRPDTIPWHFCPVSRNKSNCYNGCQQFSSFQFCFKQFLIMNVNILYKVYLQCISSKLINPLHLCLETSLVQLTISGDRYKQSGFCISASRFPLLLSSRDYMMTESSSARSNGCPCAERMNDNERHFKSEK